jgi:hypothetical protein
MNNQIGQSHSWRKTVVIIIIITAATTTTTTTNNNNSLIVVVITIIDMVQNGPSERVPGWVVQDAPPRVTKLPWIEFQHAPPFEGCIGACSPTRATHCQLARLLTRC